MDHQSIQFIIHLKVRNFINNYLIIYTTHRKFIKLRSFYEKYFKDNSNGKNNSKFYPLIWVYKKKSMYDENELEMIQIDTTHNMYRTTLTEDSFFKNHDIVTKDMYGNVQFYIKTIELDGDVIFNIEDYLFLLEE